VGLFKKWCAFTLHTLVLDAGSSGGAAGRGGVEAEPRYLVASVTFRTTTSSDTISRPSSAMPLR
jgi:hypothetical protein